MSCLTMMLKTVALIISCITVVQPTVILVPRGTASNRGKNLGDRFERGDNHMIAQAIATATGCDISHQPDSKQTIEQIISTINYRSTATDTVTTVIVIGSHSAPALTVTIVRFTDFVHTMPLQRKTALYTTAETFALSLPQSASFAARCHETVQAHGIACQDLGQAPIKQLAGFVCPAFMLDIGLPTQQASTPCIAAIADFIRKLR
ncbi:hypothetical protein M1466_03035 [Candidatus Dependentiae bacterium]|nr:hypothetical protein [Candidatus Dependentiae bacterium]